MAATLVDRENRRFQPAWTTNFFFILPTNSNKPMCLLCSDKVALIKSSSVKSHYETKHKTRYDAQHPNIASVTKTLLTIFGSTYICESAFSTLTFIKSKHRSTLTDSHTTNLLRTALLDKCNTAAITNSKTSIQLSH